LTEIEEREESNLDWEEPQSIIHPVVTMRFAKPDQTLYGPKNEYPLMIWQNATDPASITTIGRLGNLGYQTFQYALLSGASLGPAAGAVHGIAECGLHANQEDRGSPMLAAMRGILPR
jgi:hypothetical protein